MSNYNGCVVSRMCMGGILDTMQSASSKYSRLDVRSKQACSGFVSRGRDGIGKIKTAKTSPASRLRFSSDESGQWVADIIAAISASAFRVCPDDLHAPTRGNAPVALARQVALYLAHVGFGLNLTRTGQLFGRDRTTVAHACRSIEERREDPGFDACLDYLEIASRLSVESRFSGGLSGKRDL